jgi:hypothetical protein
MGAVNKQMNPQDIQRTLQNFEKESMKMDMSEEMSKCKHCVIMRGLYRFCGISMGHNFERYSGF